MNEIAKTTKMPVAEERRDDRSPMTLSTIGGEIDTRFLLQYEIAYRRPRSPTRVRDNLYEIVTMDPESAQEAMYALPRGGKPVTGPSIRFAEALKQAWGNCFASSHLVRVNREEKCVECLGLFIDFETNAVTEYPHTRSIADKHGKLFNDDMIRVTTNAANSIAMREAILKGIPKPVWRHSYESVKKVIAGDIMTLNENRELAVQAFAVYGVKAEQVFNAIGVVGMPDITLEHIATLRGTFSAIKSGEETVESIFDPAPRTGTVADPDRNPLVKEKVDKNTGEVTESSTTNGGSDDVAKETTNTMQGQTSQADKSGPDNRSAEAAQEDGHAGETPATESKSEAQTETRASPTGSEKTTSEQGSSAADAGSAQPDLLSGGAPPSSKDSKGGESAPSGQAKGADGAAVPASAPDRLRSYSKALLTIGSGGPQKLVKQSEAWLAKWGKFEGDDDKKRSAIYNLHLSRLTGEGDLESCKAAAEAIIAK